MKFESKNTSGDDNKKTWTHYYIVYVLEVSANTLTAYTSKSPRHRREHPSFLLLQSLSILPKFQEQDSKRTLFYFVSFVCFVMS